MSAPENAQNTNTTTPLTQGDEINGRKILSISSGGASVSLESGEQAAKTEATDLDNEFKRLKLQALRRGIFITTVDNPGPIQ